MGAPFEFSFMTDFFGLTPALTPQQVNKVHAPEQCAAEQAQIQQALFTYVMRAVQTGIHTPADLFQAAARRFANNVCLREVGNPRTYTYAEVNERANQVAHWAKSLGVQPGGVVGLMMENCPDFIWTYVGLSKAGQTVALINTNLTGDALAHAVKIAKCPIFIVTTKHAKQWEEAQADFQRKGIPATDVWWSMKGRADQGIPRSARSDRILDAALPKFPLKQTPPKSWRAGVTVYDPAFYIYTSGTTGNSKATRFPTFYFVASGMFGMLMQLTSDDIVYNTLPFYHSAGLMVVTVGTFYHGASLLIREKFSPSAFWKDIQKHKATAMIYIGELWGYLINQPVRPEEKNNTLRKIIGNGLRENHWREIERRFDIPTVVEFYGQSEQPHGRVQRPGGFVNCYGKQGACGFLPLAIQEDEAKGNVYLQFDVETQAPKRYEDGFCRRAAIGEPGLLVYELKVGEHEDNTYTEKSASRKPLLHDVFVKGDLWYSTGDLLRHDADGFISFVDRTGDTFRWKGENVSTNEVCAVVSTFPQVEEANVYGVEVPGEGGRAGMASILVKEGEELDVPGLRSHMSSLPSYAQPVFLRVSKSRENDKTSTFKFQKNAYQKAGFDPSKCGADELWYSDRNTAYVRLTGDVFANLQAGSRVHSKL